MKIFIYFLFLLLSPRAQQNMTIVGRVEAKSGRLPVETVHISIVGRMAETYSDGQGNFVLKIATISPTESITLRAEKAGYLTWVRIIAGNSQVPQVIYLEKAPVISHMHKTAPTLDQLKEQCLSRRDSLTCSLCIEGYDRKYKPRVDTSFLATSRDPAQSLDHANYLLALDRIERAFLNIYLSRYIQSPPPMYLTEFRTAIENDQLILDGILKKYHL
jgi:hypothetical protein